MEEVDVITLNDGDYIITDEIDINNVKYYELHFKNQVLIPQIFKIFWIK